MFPIVSFGFQSTHPRGVRRVRPFSSLQYFRVSIHAPAWGATRSPPWRRIRGSRFQSTHPRGVRPPAMAEMAARQAFQSTHPRGVRRSRRSAGGMGSASFNPRTRVGCDVWEQKRPHRKRVSIHAPAWGATRGGQIVFCQWRGFQSTHPRGVRPIDTARKALSAGVSIHAPAWGATPHFVESEVTDRFQSTHPRGVRHTRTVKELRDELVSIHAPAWGATFATASAQFKFFQFQSTHPRGVRPGIFS